MSITGIFVKYLSCLNFTFFWVRMHFSLPLYMQEDAERGPLKITWERIGIIITPALRQKPTDYIMKSVCFQMKRGMENSAPPPRADVRISVTQSKGDQHCLKVTKRHTAFERELVSFSITWRWDVGLQDLSWRDIFTGT